MTHNSNDFLRPILQPIHLEEIDGFRSPDGLHVLITAIRMRGSSENILSEPLRLWGSSAWWKNQDEISAPVLATNWEPFSLEN